MGFVQGGGIGVRRKRGEARKNNSKKRALFSDLFEKFEQKGHFCRKGLPQRSSRVQKRDYFLKISISRLTNVGFFTIL
jgi:hypothetical protein